MIRIKGNSKEKVEYKNGKIIKYNNTHSSRFCKNNGKYNKFIQMDQSLFKVPKIMYCSEERIVFEYISCNQTILDMIENNSVTEIKSIMSRIIEIIVFFLSHCNTINVTEQVQQKIYSLQSVLSSNHYDKYFTYLLESCSEIEIPVGKCHGDLTFSNILFSRKDIYFIDFLDSFVESPLLDVVKLRQDTSIQWILSMNKEKYDFNKIKIAFFEIDKEINTYFLQYKWYEKFYKMFQIINILRVIVYVEDTHTLNMLLTELERIYNN